MEAKREIVKQGDLLQPVVIKHGYLKTSNDLVLNRDDAMLAMKQKSEKERSKWTARKNKEVVLEIRHVGGPEEEKISFSLTRNHWISVFSEKATPEHFIFHSRYVKNFLNIGQTQKWLGLICKMILGVKETGL